MANPLTQEEIESFKSVSITPMGKRLVATIEALQAKVAELEADNDKAWTCNDAKLEMLDKICGENLDLQAQVARLEKIEEAAEKLAAWGPEFDEHLKNDDQRHSISSAYYDLCHTL